MNWHEKPVRRLGAWLLALCLVSCCFTACGETENQALQGGQAEEGKKGFPEGQEEGAIRKDEISQGSGESQGETGEEKEAADGVLYRFTDDLGREVAVDSIGRVAALLGSYADMWVLAGGQVCAAPIDAFEDFDLPLSEDTVNLGETKRLSLEQLLASNPDFVLASTNTPQHLEWQQALEGAGITVAYFDVACFQD